MNITNNYNLPEVLVEALTPKFRPKIRRRYSVSALCDAPLVRMLQMIHGKEATKDVSEGLNAFLGNAVHTYLDTTSTETFSEHKMVMTIKVGDYEYDISGISDHYKDGVLIDWKVTSVWSYIFGAKGLHGVKEDWFNQINVYALMHRREGRPVDEALNYVILRDWVVTKAREQDYPKIPFVAVNVPIMDSTSIASYVVDRIQLHSEAERIGLDCQTIESIPPCTAKERWEKPGVWKVLHPDLQKSMRNLETEEQAIEWLVEKTNIENAKGKKGRDMTTAKVQYVPGESTRCLSYCDVAAFCPYYEQFTSNAEI